MTQRMQADSFTWHKAYVKHWSSFLKRKLQRSFLNEGVSASDVKDKYSGKQCIILGSGPHTTKEELALVNDHPHVISVNIASILVKQSLFAVLTNPGFTRQLSPVTLSRIKTLFFVIQFWDPARNLFPQRQTIEIAVLGGLYRTKHSWNLNGVLPWGPTSILDCALPLAVWCGFQEILLVGCQYPLNCAYERVKVNSDNLERRAIDLRKTALEMERAHATWNLWAKKPHRNVKIINCTENSEIKEFPRAKLSSLV